MVRNHAENELGAKKAYENPKMEIVSLQAADIITSSGFNASSGGDEPDWTGYY